jgi:hypothetical protein
MEKTPAQNKKLPTINDNGEFKSAQNRTRTCTAVKPLVPETSVSTNFTIWADGNFDLCNQIKERFQTLCPGQDSNLHILKDTSPSSWRVYQFHHLGKAGAKIILFRNENH